MAVSDTAYVVVAAGGVLVLALVVHALLSMMLQ